MISEDRSKMPTHAAWQDDQWLPVNVNFANPDDGIDSVLEIGPAGPTLCLIAMYEQGISFRHPQIALMQSMANIDIACRLWLMELCFNWPSIDLPGRSSQGELR